MERRISVCGESEHLHSALDYMHGATFVAFNVSDRDNHYCKCKEPAIWHFVERMPK